MKLLLLHGLGQTSQAWDSVIEKLHHIDCQALELFDNGRLPKEYHVLEDKVRKELLNSSEGVLVVGLSLGGSLALSLLNHPPKNLKGVMVCAGQYRMTGNFFYHIQKWLFKLMPQSAFVEHGLDKYNLYQFYQSMKDFDLTQTLKAASLPCRVVCGSRDKVNRGTSKKIAQLIPQATYKEIPKAGHLLTKDAPGDLAKMIKTFYEEMEQV